MSAQHAQRRGNVPILLAGERPIDAAHTTDAALRIDLPDVRTCTLLHTSVITRCSMRVDSGQWTLDICAASVTPPRRGDGTLRRRPSRSLVAYAVLRTKQRSRPSRSRHRNWPTHRLVRHLPSVSGAPAPRPAEHAPPPLHSQPRDVEARVG